MNRFTKVVFAAAIAIGLSTAASAETLRIHGSSTFFNKILKQHQAAIEKESGVKLSVSPNGSGHGIEDLMSGKADLAMSSSTLHALIEKMNKKTPGAVDESKVQGHFIALTRVAFITHPSNPAKELSLSQLRGILSGKIKNWSEVGGPSKPIQIIAEDASGGLRAFTEKMVLKGKSIGGNVKEMKSGSDIAPEVSKTPNAFGVAAFATVTKSVKELKTVIKVVQPLILVSKGAPSATAKKVMAAMKTVLDKAKAGS